MSNKQDIKSTKKTRRSRKTASIQKSFVPKFWELADNRVAVIKAVKRRAEQIKQDCRADSIQKRIIAERACFVSIRLESMEIDSIQSGTFDNGQYCALNNTLLGLLKSLGLERKAKQVMNLKSYIESKDKSA